MRVSVQILPGVRRVGMLPCSSLPANVALSAICGLRVPLMADVEPVPLCGVGECRCVRTRQGASVSETATLTFSSHMMLDGSRDMAFVVEDVQCRTWLVGSREAPFPVLSATRMTGVPGGEPAGVEYEVTLSSLRSMVDCVAVW